MMRRGVPLLVGLAAGAAGGWLLFPRVLYVREHQPLQYSHAVHTGEEVGLTCDTCHGFDAEGRFTGTPSIGICADCHESMVGESDDERRLVEEFLATRTEVPWQVYARQPDNVRFPHAAHVKLAGLPCEGCHGDHGSSGSLRPLERNRVSGYSRDIWGTSLSGWFRGRRPGMKMNDCSACHARSGVDESCLDCHR